MYEHKDDLGLCDECGRPAVDKGGVQTAVIDGKDVFLPVRLCFECMMPDEQDDFLREGEFRVDDDVRDRALADDDDEEG